MSDTSSTTADDRALLCSVASGDSHGIETLFHSHCNRILNYVYRRIGGRREDAEEIMQDTFLTALKLARTFRGEASIFVWLCGIANLRIKDFLRKQRRDRRIPAEALTSLQSLGELGVHDAGAQARSVVNRLESAELMDLLLAGLSSVEREALLLRYVEELSVKEIAFLLKRSERAVDSILIRAKRKPREIVRRWILDHGEVEP